MILETVKIKSDRESGYIIINKSDFHGANEEYVEAEVQAKKPKKKAASK